MNLLTQIDSPADLRKLDMKRLPDLAEEIRQLIIDTVAKTGGHLAPNLGVVELTLALHYAFDTPGDKLVWDVGHQCYTHKIITGRKTQFSSLRQFDGLSGFCNREESVYDVHTTGHSSNSISLALGMAEARKQSGANHQVVAVIGDGALTGGMALEALNHAGDLGIPLIVVLNDNEMSIGGNVGALSRHLSRMRAMPSYNQAKDYVRRHLSRLPWLGPKLLHLGNIIKRSVKSALMPGMFFENLGYVYLGPIDGHNIKAMVDLMRQAQQIKRPVLLHVRTVKGKGYLPAEQAPEHWHGANPFHVENGAPRQTPCKAYTNVFSEALLQWGERDPRVIAITAAMAEGTGLAPFAARYPERFFDTGIAEQHAVTFAAGLASCGLKPVLAIYSTFLQRAYDQIMEDVCLQKLPVVFAIDRAGVVGGDGFSHQGFFDLSYLRTIPGMTVLAPADGGELRAMLDYALAQSGPSAIRWPKADALSLAEHPHPPLETGRSVMLRQGKDGSIFAIGSMVSVALDVADLLQKEGQSFQVVDARFAAPLDQKALLKAAETTQRIVTIEENILSGGFGEGCRSVLAGSRTDLLTLGLPQCFLPHGSRNALLPEVGLSAGQITQAILERWFRP